MEHYTVLFQLITSVNHPSSLNTSFHPNNLQPRQVGFSCCSSNPRQHFLFPTSHLHSSLHPNPPPFWGSSPHRLSLLTLLPALLKLSFSAFALPSTLFRPFNTTCRPKSLQSKHCRLGLSPFQEAYHPAPAHTAHTLQTNRPLLPTPSTQLSSGDSSTRTFSSTLHSSLFVFYFCLRPPSL